MSQNQILYFLCLTGYSYSTSEAISLCVIFRKKVVQAIFSMFSSSYLVVERVQVLKVVQAPGLSDYRGEDGFQVARWVLNEYMFNSLGFVCILPS